MGGVPLKVNNTVVGGVGVAGFKDGLDDDDAAQFAAKEFQKFSVTGNLLANRKVCFKSIQAYAFGKRNIVSSRRFPGILYHPLKQYGN